MKSFLILFVLLSSAVHADSLDCLSYEGTWLYRGTEYDGFNKLKMKISCDQQAPLPREYLAWAGEENLMLRGFVEFDVDSYLMGPFPFGSIESKGSRFLTHYFYHYSGQPSYQYENFEILIDSAQDHLTLWDQVECDAGKCEEVYLFNRLKD